MFELCNIGGIKPEQLMARSGKALSFTLNGERVTLARHGERSGGDIPQRQGMLP